jgi:hypothetical protein
LIAVDDVEGVLAPVVVDVVAFERLRRTCVSDGLVGCAELDGLEQGWKS